MEISTKLRKPLLKECKKVVNEIFNTLATRYMNSLLPRQYPRVYYLYPDWPNDAPTDLHYKSPQALQQKVKRKAKRVSLKPEIELTEFVGYTKATKRNSRYKGKYDDASIEVKLAESSNEIKAKSSSNSLTNEITKSKKARTISNLSTEQPGAKKVCKLPVKVKRIRTLSDSSLSESENEDFTKIMEIKEVPKNSLIPIDVKPVSNIKLLKESFLNKNFDEAMKEYAQKKKEISPPNKILPPIIPPPLSDPTKRAKKRKIVQKQEINPDAHLGGIFTINNGWDKPIPKKEPPKMIPREKRFLPKISFIQQGLLHNNNEDHGNYDVELDGIANNNEYGSDDEIKGNRIKKRFFDSEDEENIPGRIDPDSPENTKQSDSGCDESSELMLFDDDNLDDLIDEEDLKHKEKKQKMELLVTELDDTCLKIRLERPKTPEPEPSIIENPGVIFAVDPEIDEIIITVYGGACPGFLEYRCMVEKCSRLHSLLPKNELYDIIFRLPPETLLEAHKVLVRFHRLFKEYVTAFAHLYGIRRNENMLIQLIKDCETHPRILSCFRPIIDHLILSKFANKVDSIKFLLQHHNPENTPSRDVIINIILDIAGPDVIKFVDYIGYVIMRQRLPISAFQKLIKLCNEYSAPQFPFICLNYMLTMNSKELSEVDQTNMTNFLKTQNTFVRLYDSRANEAKLLGVLEKLHNSQQTTAFKNELKGKAIQPHQVFLK